MRVIFLGTPCFAVPALRALIDSRYDVAAVFTQPDRPAGRGHAIHPPPVKIVAQEKGIPVFQPQKIRADENRSVFAEFRPDFIVVAAFGQILPPWLLQSATVAPVNIHPSLLPRYRGAAPVVWTLLNGDTVSGVTTMLMDEHLDTGPILLQKEVPVPESATGGDFEATLADVGARLLIDTLDGLASKAIQPAAQNDTLATLAPRITKEMGQIDWALDALAIHNRIRALNPWPLAFTDFRGQRVQILSSRREPPTGPSGSAPGGFLETTRDGVRVQCGGGTALELLRVQLPSKKPVSGREFAAGARLKAGDALFSIQAHTP